MTSLIQINTIADRAERLGFRVERYVGAAYIHAPEKTVPDAIWHNGACYTSAEFIISDRCEIGYGYNSAFYGPFHPGYCRADNFGLSKLRQHPRWQEAA